jgi:general secretion pathway protein G
MKRIANRSANVPRRRGGFTLIEILIVIAIILVIAAMAVPQLMGRQRAAMVSAAKITVKEVEKATKFYAADHDGEFPQGGQEVWEQLLQQSEYRNRKLEPYLEEMPNDPWGELLNYTYPPEKNQGSKPDIWSNGPNRTDDGGGADTDDVGNWPIQSK